MAPYQLRAVQHILDNPRAMLPIEMGGGKTIITLTALAELLDRGEIYGAMVIGTVHIANTVWKQEAASWEHTRHLRVRILRGESKAVLARRLLRPDTDIWISNYEALPWLWEQLNKLFLAREKYPPMNALVFDEITRIKRTTGTRIGPWYKRDRTSKTRMLDYFPRRIGLTGLPAPNGYMDLFGQYYAIDDGERLGVSLEAYKTAFFTGGNMIGSKPRLTGGSKERIEGLIQDITFALTTDEIMSLPPFRYNDLFVDLTGKDLAAYRQMEDQLFADIDAGRVVAANAGVAAMKCRQLANGMLIDTETGSSHVIHDLKLQVLDEILEEANGAGVVVAYQFKVDRTRILERYAKSLRVCVLDSSLSAEEADRRISRWNNGEYEMFLIHPRSGGHGLNIQHFGNTIAWFGIDHDYELFAQVNARLRRKGQKSDHVMVHRIMARDSVEDNVVLPNLLQKTRDHTGLMRALIEYRNRRQARIT